MRPDLHDQAAAIVARISAAHVDGTIGVTHRPRIQRCFTSTLLAFRVLSWIVFFHVGFDGQAGHACHLRVDHVGRARRVDWALRVDTLTRDAGRGDDRLGARPPLFDRLHGTRIRTGRASSPICRSSPSPC